MTYDEEKKVADIIVALTELIGALESELAHEASHRQKLQNALAYWMPGVTEEIEISTNGRCGDDALLLVGSEGAFEDKCWGNEVLARAEAAEAEVKRYRVALIAAKTRMRNCRGAIESDQVVDKDVHGSLQNGIRDIEDALSAAGPLAAQTVTDKEPTERMLLAGSLVDWKKYSDKKEAARDVWNVMHRNAGGSALASTGGEHNGK